MNSPRSLNKSRLVGGTTWITLAEALMLPTGFLTVVFLTRRLGLEGYGLFALAGTLVVWIEWAVNSIFSQTTIKFISEAAEWQAIASKILRTQLTFSLLATLALALLAPAIASLLNEPALTYLLWLSALEIPLFNLTLAHQNMMVGLGKFEHRAIVSAVRWVSRFLLIICLVKLGFSIPGAILGSVAAMLLSLLICRCYIRPSLWYPLEVSSGQLAGYAIPLFFSALAMRLYEKVDLFALKALGGTAEEAGLYASAQNLALLGGVVSPALAPVLIAAIGRALNQGNLEQIKALSAAAMRVVLLHLPFAGMVAGASSEIVGGLFGAAFVPAAPLLAVLIFSAIATVSMGVTGSILVASEKPRWTFFLTAPMPAIALVGHWLLIPRWGAIGASSATLLAATLGALAGIIAVYVNWRVLPPFLTLVRSCLVCGVVTLLAMVWKTTGVLLLLKLTVVSLAIPLLLWLFGEFNAADRALLRSFFKQK